MATSLAIKFECPVHFNFAAKVKALMLSERSFIEVFRCNHIGANARIATNTVKHTQHC